MGNETDRLFESQALARQLLVRRDETYGQVAEELHEQVIQDLFAARTFLELALADLDPRKINGVRDELLRVANDLRVMVRELQPFDLSVTNNCR
jgi:glucose-6-phosphate-specific signal transduction histidine kinase